MRGRWWLWHVSQLCAASMHGADCKGGARAIRNPVFFSAEKQKLGARGLVVVYFEVPQAIGCQLHRINETESWGKERTTL